METILRSILKLDYQKAEKPYTVFLYSHRFPLDIKDEEQRDLLDSNSGNCLPRSAKLTILEKHLKKGQNLVTI